MWTPKKMSNLPEEQEPSESSERWLVSYADFMTLLFAFFAVLYATSEVNLEKTKELEQSIKKYVIKLGAFGDSGDKTSQGQKENTPIEPPIKTYQKETPKDPAKRVLQTLLLKEFSEKELTAKLVDFSEDTSGYRLVIDETQVFANLSAKFKPKALEFLDRLAIVLKNSNAYIRIENSYKSDQVSSRLYPTSWDLTSARSTTLARYFNSVHKIPAEKLIGLAFGPQKDAELNDLNLKGLVEILVTREPL